jgi:hypothetical protein
MISFFFVEFVHNFKYDSQSNLFAIWISKTNDNVNGIQLYILSIYNSENL